MLVLTACVVTKFSNIQEDQTESEYERYNPKVGFLIDSFDMFLQPTNLHSFTCCFQTSNMIEQRDVFVHTGAYMC